MPHYGGESPHYVEFSNMSSGEGVDFSSPRQHTNPMYAEAQVAILNGTPPTLPAPRKSSAVRPVSPDHYERLPGVDVVKEVVASGKYDRLKPESKQGPGVIQSGKYDSLSSTATPTATDNLYVIERGDGYKVLPGNPRPTDTKNNELVDVELPLANSNFNPYDSS